DGYVYFGFNDQQAQTRGLARIRADGGAIDTLVKTDASVVEIAALPNGRGLIVTLNRNGDSELNALDLRTHELRKLDAAGSLVHFVEPGYLIFVRGGSIMAAPF